MDEHGASGAGFPDDAGAGKRFSEILETVVSTGSDFVVTVQGRPKAVILPYDEYESLVETLNILSDPDTMAVLEESAADIREGRLADLNL